MSAIGELTKRIEGYDEDKYEVISISKDSENDVIFIEVKMNLITHIICVTSARNDNQENELHESFYRHISPSRLQLFQRKIIKVYLL